MEEKFSEIPNLSCRKAEKKDADKNILISGPTAHWQPMALMEGMKCHSRTFAQGELEKGDRMIKEADRLMAEAIRIVADLNQGDDRGTA